MIGPRVLPGALKILGYTFSTNGLIWIISTCLGVGGGVLTRDQIQNCSRLHDFGLFFDFKNFYRRHARSFVSSFIGSFEITQSNRFFVSSLTPLFEISTKAFQFYCVTSYPYHFGSDPIRLHAYPLEDRIQKGSLLRAIQFGYG